MQVFCCTDGCFTPLLLARWLEKKEAKKEKKERSVYKSTLEYLTVIVAVCGGGGGGRELAAFAAGQYETARVSAGTQNCQMSG